HPHALTVGAALGSPADPAEGRPAVHARQHLNERALSLAENDPIEGSEAKQELGLESSLHATGNQQRMRCQAPCKMGELKVKAQRHAGWGDADDGPGTAQNLTLQSTGWGLSAAVGIEDLDGGARGLEHTRQTPDPKRWREEGVFPTVGIVWANQQHTG